MTTIKAPVSIVEKYTFTIEQVLVALIHDGWSIPPVSSAMYINNEGELVIKCPKTTYLERGDRR